MKQSTQNQNNLKIIFLDIDGVLNGYDTCIHLILIISNFFGLREKLLDKYDIFGVSLYKTFLLWLIIKLTSAKVVISSSWRFGWDIPYNEKVGRQKILHDRLKLFNIEIIDRTGRVGDSNRYSIRELEIKEWISNNNFNGKFIILDDEDFDLKSFINKELIKTSNTVKNIKGFPKEHSGLRVKHVFQSIKKLGLRR